MLKRVQIYCPTCDAEGNSLTDSDESEEMREGRTQEDSFASSADTSKPHVTDIPYERLMSLLNEERNRIEQEYEVTKAVVERCIAEVEASPESSAALGRCSQARDRYKIAANRKLKMEEDPEAFLREVLQRHARLE